MISSVQYFLLGTRCDSQNLRSLKMVPPSALSIPLYVIAGGIVMSRLSLDYERDKALFVEDCV